MAQILSVKDLTVDFDGHIVLKDVSFDLDAGASMAIVGPNGSGKTVLLKSLLGILPHNGTVAWAPNVKVSYVPQKIDADRHLPMNLKNLLEAKAAILHLKEKDVHAVSQTIGITPDILKTPVGHLSGGQFQKALIALALLGNPNVILFDEPTASLDELSEEHIYDLIHDLQEKHNITTILVSHDLSIVYQYATVVFCLNKEKICFGAPDEALTPEVLKKLYATPHRFHHHASHENT